MSSEKKKTEKKTTTEKTEEQHLTYSLWNTILDKTPSQLREIKLDPQGTGHWLVEGLRKFGASRAKRDELIKFVRQHVPKVKEASIRIQVPHAIFYITKLELFPIEAEEPEAPSAKKEKPQKKTKKPKSDINVTPTETPGTATGPQNESNVQTMSSAEVSSPSPTSTATDVPTQSEQGTSA